MGKLHPENLKPITSSEQAREMQKKAMEARKRNTAERKLIKERILERMGAEDWDEMIDQVIARAKESDKGFEVLRDTIGEKPTDKVEITDTTIEVNICED